MKHLWCRTGPRELAGWVMLGVGGAWVAVSLPYEAALALIASLVLLAIATGVQRVERAAATMAVLTAALMPMNRVAVALVPISDLLMLAALGLFVLTRLVNDTRPAWSTYRPLIIGLSLLAIGGLVGAIFEAPGVFLYKALGEPIRDVSGWSQNMGNLAKFIVGSFAPVGLWVVIPQRRALVERLVIAFVMGCSVSAAVGLALPQGRLGQRMVGLTVHPNQFGSLCVLGLGAALGVVLSRRRLPAWGFVVLPVLAVGVLGSGSRAALGGLLVLGAIVGPLTRSRAVMAVALTGAALVLILFAVGAIRAEGQNAVGRALGSDPSAAGSNEIRADLAERVFDRWLARPITGNGFNYMRPSHNVYLGVLASTGVIGVVGFGLIITTILRRAWRRRSDMLVACVSAGYFAYLLNAYFDNIFWWRWLWFTVGMVVAVGATTSTRGDPTDAESTDAEPERAVRSSQPASERLGLGLGGASTR